MAVRLSRQAVIDAQVLEKVAETRLREAEALFEAGFFQGAIYLAGYAVECYLKLAICATLGWDELYGAFMVHDLEGLLLYSGCRADLQRRPEIQESFAIVCETWTVEGARNIRYETPEHIDRDTAELVLDCVRHSESGVVPWLREMIASKKRPTR
jgi:HEPN domain-containing protein